MFCRFDDLRNGLAIAFERPVATVTAVSEAEVLPVLAAVEDANREGRWAAGFVSYEAAGGLDPALATSRVGPGGSLGDLPLASFGIFEGPVHAEPLTSSTTTRRHYVVEPWEPEFDLAAYTGKIECLKEHIEAGDTYQCNLTLRMRSRARGDLLALYGDLALAQRGSYNAYVDTGRFVLASASPELFFEWSDGWLVTKPMKGTCARGRWPSEDADRARWLAGSRKDRAENLMIVDLLRNDLGRVAEWGSVEVPALFELERYETLWQLTSTVRARPRSGIRLEELFRALFPCGSVTGAPKPRTMALIAELEESRRGAYCGSIGVAAPSASHWRARFNVAIRTVVVDRKTAQAVYGTGGGITWDSSAATEHAELMTKAAILAAPPEEFALVETLAFIPGRGLRNGERHLRRLMESAKYFGFDIDAERVRSVLEASVAGLGESRRVRLLVARSGYPSVELGPMPSSMSRAVVLDVDTEPVSSAEIWPYHKTTRRSAYETRAARHPGADDVILVNERGQPTETTIANLAVNLDGRWWTPPIETGCLPGIERCRLVELGNLTDRVLTLDDLTRAAGIAVVSSLRGWRRAVLAIGK